MGETMSDRPLTVAQVAERWACSRDAVYALIRTGQLPHFRVGGKLLRIKPGDVLAWENGGGMRSVNTDCNSSMDKPAPSGEIRTAPATGNALDDAKAKARREAALRRGFMQSLGPT